MYRKMAPHAYLFYYDCFWGTGTYYIELNIIFLKPVRDIL